MAKEKTSIELDNGETVEIGSSKELTGEETVIVSDWNPGQAPHFGVPFSLIAELVTKEKLEKLGEYNGTPVVEASDVIGLIKSAVEAHYGVTWKAERSGSGVKNLKENVDAAIKLVMDMSGCDEAEARKKIAAFKNK